MGFTIPETLLVFRQQLAGFPGKSQERDHETGIPGSTPHNAELVHSLVKEVHRGHALRRQSERLAGELAQAVGQPLVDVLQLQSDSVLWNLVADELRSFLKGIEGANLLRREELAFIASQAYSFGSQLARSPVNADLVPQVEEIKRLKTLARRKRAPQSPPPPSPAPALETSTASKS